jgi:hypothetical protein
VGAIVKSSLNPSFGRSTVVLGALLAATSWGCGGAAPSAEAASPAPSQTVTPEQQALRQEAHNQRVAQTAWCGYLQELYKRAAKGATSWPRYQQCVGVTTLASPRMLKQTADCSLAALQRFQGDPFTPEYASEVSRCGSEALDRMAVSPSEMAPFVATICGRMTACGQIDYSECNESLRAGLGVHFERVIGAINTTGRAQLRTCLKSLSCQDMAAQVTGCLEPLMDGLLWLPG